MSLGDSEISTGVQLTTWRSRA